MGKKSEAVSDSSGAGAGDVRSRLLRVIPLAERRLELAEIDTAVLEGGDGPPMVLLHGAGEFAATWMRAIPLLVTTHRVIVPDLPGHGASVLPREALDRDRTIAWLGELMEQTCTSEPVLVGHLLGGGIAARYALRHRDRISELVLVDSFGLGRLRPSPRFGLALLRFVVRPTRRSQDGLFRQCMVDLDGVRAQMGESWDLMATYALECSHAPGQSAAVRALMSGFGGRIDPPELDSLTVPTTLIWGRHDRQVRLRVAEAASARHRWPLHVIEEVGDDPAGEGPVAFVEALSRAIAAT